MLQKDTGFREQNALLGLIISATFYLDFKKDANSLMKSYFEYDTAFIFMMLGAKIFY